MRLRTYLLIMAGLVIGFLLNTAIVIYHITTNTWQGQHWISIIAVLATFAVMIWYLIDRHNMIRN